MTLTGLLPATAYQWRVRTICAAGTSAPSAIQAFTTLGPPCPDPYEPNNSKSALAAIPVNTDIFASIATGTDQDWYSFSNTAAQPNIRINLTQLPANYTLILYSSAGRSLVKSARSGTTDEVISYNTNTVGTYWVQVIGSSSAFNPSICYKLRVNIQSGTNLPEITGTLLSNDPAVSMHTAQITETGTSGKKWMVYPNPAKGTLNYTYKGKFTGMATISLTDPMGRNVLEKSAKSMDGQISGTLVLPEKLNGFYFLILNNGRERIVEKVLIMH